MSLASFFGQARQSVRVTSSATRTMSTLSCWWNNNSSASQHVVRSIAPFMQQRRYAHNGDISGYKSQVCSVLGAQWGDEGKGKLVDILAKRYDVIARFNGGANAGHTLVVEGKKYAFHLLPCGILYPGKLNVIGNGVVCHVPTLFNELKKLDDAGVKWNDGRLKISDRAHLLFDAHMLIDGLQEGKLKDPVGTTKRGIGPCYSSKATRNGVRVGDLLHWDTFKEKHRILIQSLQSLYKFDYNIDEEQSRYEKFRDDLKPMIVDSAHLLNALHAQGKTILAEGANAALLDVDHGTYPFVTSSATAAGGICTGLGLAPTKIDSSIGVVKAYTTRVGSGPFPTELKDAMGDRIRETGGEYGTTTGRPRRCGWLDIPVVQYSHMLNNYTSINITKLDVLSDLDEIKIGVSYLLDGKTLPAGFMPSHLNDFSRVQVRYETMKGWKSDISKITDFKLLPKEAKEYIKRVEQLTGLTVSWIGVGAGRKSMVPQGFAAQW